MTVYVSPDQRDVVTIAGPEAATYLQGQLSQDVSALGVDDSAWTFVLSPQGKVDGWGRLHRVDAETYELDLDRGAGADVQARLQRFLLRTKAAVTLEEGVPSVAVVGAELPRARPAFGGGATGDVLRASPGDLRDEVADDAVLLDAEQLDALRIRGGVPRWGVEADHDTIPATLGQWVIDASVSFTKGCFTGQELVARIDSRGGNVPRRLCGFVVDGAPPAAGTPVLVDGAEVGTVTRAATDPEGVAVGLAFVGRATEVPADATVDGRPTRLTTPPIPTA